MNPLWNTSKVQSSSESPLWLTVMSSLYRGHHHIDTDWTCPTTDTNAVINKENICLGRVRWFVTYSPSSDSLSESWLMMSFLCSNACSRAAWSFRGNSEASSSIYKQGKTLQSPVINNHVWRTSFKGTELQQRTAPRNTVFLLQTKSWFHKQ